MKTSKKQISLFTEDKSTYLPEGFRVNHIQQQENEKGKKMTGISGQKCLEQFEKFNRATLWAKMFAASLIGTEGWFSTKCNLIWKLKVSKCYRFYFQLVPLTLHTDEIESGLLPTPNAMDTMEGCNLRKDNNLAAGGKHGVSLHHLSHLGLLPTPKATEIEEDYSEWKKRMVASGNPKNMGKTTTNLGTMARNGMIPTPTAHQQNTQFKQGGTCLQAALLKGVLPTPTARDYRSGFQEDSDAFNSRKEHSRGVNLHEHIQRSVGENFQLNPQFVMEMMGFPSDWTLLPFLKESESQT